ncbi:MAG: nitroreductase family protein, partial [Dehalococcoidia bacterium]|nr:nitroreductase family protein [Dehalococcoidia bacterium]
MDLLEAIEGRISIRAYKTTPVPKENLVKLLEAARRSPSWANTQPWEFAVLGGGAIAEVKRRLEQKVAENAVSVPDMPWPTLPDKYMDRQRENGKQVFATLGLAREDKEKRRQWM